MLPDIEEITKLQTENNELLKQNNHLLRTMHRNAVIAFWVKIIWIAVLLGVPFILYYYFLKPYLREVGTSPGSVFEQYEIVRDSFESLNEVSKELQAERASQN